ncbi:hypothetical protein PG996_014307 [Apiospora saccharicola]|uniref:Uncharacterized protein n=1 Tax=Apiospora saccharicola TaxID=335842 RepID=A0ABR1THY8_9PEZI
MQRGKQQVSEVAASNGSRGATETPHRVDEKAVLALLKGEGQAAGLGDCLAPGPVEQCSSSSARARAVGVVVARAVRSDDYYLLTVVNHYLFAIVNGPGRQVL